MSAATIETPSTTMRAGSSTRTRHLRPGWGSGRSTRPVSRSIAGVGAPQIGRGRPLRADAHACRAECSPAYSRPVAVRSAAGAVSTSWRLTNRGIALVLIAGAVLVAAALTVITATALTVTSDHYHSHGSALANR